MEGATKWRESQKLRQKLLGLTLSACQCSDTRVPAPPHTSVSAVTPECQRCHTRVSEVSHPGATVLATGCHGGDARVRRK